MRYDGVKNAFVSVGSMFSELIRAIFFIAVPIYISWKITSIAVVLGCFFVLPFYAFLIE